MIRVFFRLFFLEGVLKKGGTIDKNLMRSLPISNDTKFPFFSSLTCLFFFGGLMMFRPGFVLYFSLLLLFSVSHVNRDGAAAAIKAAGARGYMELILILITYTHLLVLWLNCVFSSIWRWLL